VGVKVVIARLRPKKDDDIRQALSELPSYYDESDVIREALRQFLFSHKGRIPLLLASRIENENNDKLVDESSRDEKMVLERVLDEEDDDLEAALDNLIKK
jgi:Arc/MetJ-type ribon-helix-helix transcriptional regulator